MQKTLLIILGIVVILAAVFAFAFIKACEDDWCFVFEWQKVKAADSFHRCASLGFPVMESYPRQCRAGDRTFTEEISPIDHPLIHVAAPSPNSLLTSPVVIQGEARGNWYFEASFPVRLLDANGREIAIAPAQAKGDWMTTEFVPFELSLPFTKPTTSTGVLILEKDNPSGLPEHDDSVSIPVRF